MYELHIRKWRREAIYHIPVPPKYIHHLTGSNYLFTTILDYLLIIILWDTI